MQIKHGPLKPLSTLLATLILLTSTLWATTPPTDAAHATGLDAKDSKRVNPPDYDEAFLLGIVEGLTEYLPVSSTGHLILANHFLKLDEEIPIYNGEGEPFIITKNGVTRPFTLRDAINTYSIVIQGGAIIAVLILYWRRVLDILKGIVGRSPQGLLLARNLIAAFIPAAIIGLLLADIIEEYLFNPASVCIALAAGAFLMMVTEFWRKLTQHESDALGPDLHELSLKQSVMIGLLQCISMWPGTSRSMMSIVGGYFAGLRPARAAEFSFLLGLITLSAASGYKALTAGKALLTLNVGPLIFGIAVATIAAAIAVKFLVHILNRHGLAPFAYYRIILATAIVLFFYIL